MKSNLIMLAVAACSIAHIMDRELAPTRRQGPGRISANISPWPKSNGDAANTGRGKGNTAGGRLKWVFRSGSPVLSSPVIGADGTLYAGCWNRKVYAIDGGTGTKRWEFDCIGRILGSPALSTDDTLFVASQDGRVHALETTTGVERWAFSCFSAVPNIEEELRRERPGYNPSGYCSIDGSPAIGPDGTVYVGIAAGGAGMAAINGRTGAVKWQLRDGGATRSCPAILPDRTIIESKEDLRLINSATGKVIAQIMLPLANGEPALGSGGSWSTPVVGDDGTIFFGRSDSHQIGQFFAIDSHTKTVRWRLRGGNSYGVPAVSRDGVVYVGRGSRSDKSLCMFYSIAGRSGRILWERQFDGHLFSAPAIASDGTVYVGNQDWSSHKNGHLYALDGATGSVKWSVEVPGSPSNPAIGADGTVYVGCDVGVLAIE